jgi:hypothetical protein
MKLRSAGLISGLLLLSFAAPAAAAPVTVNLRVEGVDRTLFEDPVTIDVRPFSFSGDPTQHTCDGTSANQGPATSPQPTRGGALAASGIELAGAWSDSFGNPTFTRVAGEAVDDYPTTQRFLAEYQNGQFASHGACGDPVQNGDDVLFAHATGSETLLKLTGPGTAKPGEAVTAKVTDAGSGAAVADATVAGQKSAADGSITVGPFSDRGDHDVKATKDGAIRSNRLRVCVTDGADGACGTSVPGRPASPPAGGPDVTPPAARISAIGEKQRFARRKGPRTLRGSVAADPSGIAQVKLGLSWSRGGHCRIYSPTKERFRGAKCGHRTYFKVGDGTDFSYLLPKRLGPGRYVLDVVAIDKAGNRTPLARGVNRMVFFVR